jgi:hypothetical protein
MRLPVVLDDDPILPSSIGQGHPTGAPVDFLQSEGGLLGAADPKSFWIEIGVVIQGVNLDSRAQSKRAVGNDARPVHTLGSKPNVDAGSFAPNVKVSESNPCRESTLGIDRGKASLPVAQL